MALKIIKSDDPIQVDQIVIAIYSNPGLGKTTLGFSSNLPLLFDFDSGSHRSAIRNDTVIPSSWPDVKDVTPEDLEPYKTVIVDTAGRALDMLTVDIIKRNPKMGYGGALTLQGYGQLKAEFTSWLKMLKFIGKDVVLIAHSSEERKGDDLIERLDVQGGSKNEIYKSADAMGRILIENGKRILNFSPSDIAFGKNPGQFEPLIIPKITESNSFLADIIDSIKEKLNSMTEEQARRQKIIADYLSMIDENHTADHFNKMIKEVKKADKAVVTILKSALHKKATDAGFKYDKDNGYIETV